MGWVLKERIEVVVVVEEVGKWIGWGEVLFVEEMVDMDLEVWGVLMFVGIGG